MNQNPSFATLCYKHGLRHLLVPEPVAEQIKDRSNANPPPPGYCDVATLKQETSQQISARIGAYKSAVKSCDWDIDWLTEATWIQDAKEKKERGWIRSLFTGKHVRKPVPVYTGPA
jgi:hypothetical protein